MRKLDFPSELKLSVAKNSGGQKPLKVAENNDFTFFGWFFFVVVKYHQKLMFEFNLESVFPSHFFKKRFDFADFPEDMLKTCPIVKGSLHVLNILRPEIPLFEVTNVID